MSKECLDRAIDLQSTDVMLLDMLQNQQAQIDNLYHIITIITGNYGIDYEQITKILDKIKELRQNK